MPALFPLRLALTKEQDEWLKQRSLASGKTGAEIVSALLEAEIGQANPTARLAEMVRLLSEAEARSRRLEATLEKQHEVVMLFLKEMYREGSANLYRIESVIDDFPDPILVRQRLNEYVRTRDREMGERLFALYHPERVR
jgi:hypothetical protein